MTRGRARIHLVGTKGPHTALCGWSHVDMQSDVSITTCKACLSCFAQKRTHAPDRRAPKFNTAASDVAAELAKAFAATLAPRADASPLITPQLWAVSCKGAEHRRCGECEVCEWERSAQLWAAVSPWNKEHNSQRSEGAPRWSSLAAALSAFAEWERHDRSAPSALGGILDRVRRGDAGDAGSARTDDPLLRRAAELVRVRQALEAAYPDGAHVLDAGKCKAVLLLRTPGVASEVPTYEALSVVLGVAIGELRALVSAGRKRVTEELASRGLIPRPRFHHRTVGAASMHSQEVSL